MNLQASERKPKVSYFHIIGDQLCDVSIMIICGIPANNMQMNSGVKYSGPGGIPEKRQGQLVVLRRTLAAS